MKSRYLPYWLIAPALVFTLVLFIYPSALVTAQAFTAKDGSGGFVLDHMRTMLAHWKFNKALSNTFLLVLLVIPLQLGIALALAQMLTRIQRGRDTLLYIWTIPLGISDLAAGIIWLAIFEQTGFLNTVMMGMGLIDKPTSFLGYADATSTLVAVVLAEVWRATAIVLVIIVSGMGLIPKEYGEAAEVFGASPWQKFRRVTLPLLKPSLQTALVLRTILAFEVFAVVVALSGTQYPVLMGETYTWQFTLQDPNVAAAYAMVILAVSILSTVFYLRVLRTPEGVRA